MSNKNKLGQEPVFSSVAYGLSGSYLQEGLSKREYAAIELRVPDSGEEWLDEMIRKANRMDAAIAAMQGILSTSAGLNVDGEKLGLVKHQSIIIELAYEYADELLKQESNEPK